VETLTSLERLDLSKNTLGDEPGTVEFVSVLGELCAVHRQNLRVWIWEDRTTWAVTDARS
jgi:hypothetical protein